METHERGPWAVGLLVAASLCVGVGNAHAQSTFFLRLAPEVGPITVEHTKKVTIQGGSSSSTSSSSGLALASNLSAGLRLKLRGNWLLGVEVEGVVSGRRKLKGTIPPTPNGNIHDVWPGQWDFSDLSGVGGNIIFGRGLGDGRSQLYLFGGRRRTWTEFASGATNPETGEASEDRKRLGRWQWTIGAGTTLHLKLPVDFRVRYFRSHIDWTIPGEAVRLDYRYTESGVVASVGIHIFD